METPDRLSTRLSALLAMALSLSAGWATQHEGLELVVEARQIVRLVMSERAFNEGVGAVCAVVFVAAAVVFVGETIRVGLRLRRLRAQHARELRAWDPYFRLEGPAPGVLLGEGAPPGEAPARQTSAGTGGGGGAGSC